MPRFTDRQKELLTGLGAPVALCLLFVVGEFTLREIHARRYGTSQGIEDETLWRTDPDVGVPMPRPGAVMGSIAINSLGFRGPELDVPKPEGRRRIAFVGGSATYDPQAPDNEHSWPHLTIEALRRTFPDVDLDYVNGALPGVHTGNLADLVDHHLAALEPDLYLIYSGSLDLNYNLQDLAKTQGVYEHADDYQSALGEVSVLASWIEKNVRVRRIARGAHRDEGKLAFAAHEVAAPFERDLEELIDRCLATGADVALSSFAIWPRSEQSSADQSEAAANSLYYMPYLNVSGLLEGFAATNEVIRRVAARRNLPCIDVVDVVPADGLHWADTMHLRAAGGERLAEAVAEGLAATGWLGSKP